MTLEYDINTRRWTIQINEWKYRALEKAAKANGKAVSNYARTILEEAASELIDQGILTPEDDKIILGRIEDHLKDRERKRK